MADLTGTVAHQARLEMLDVLEEAHAKSPGGIFYADRRPDRKESHISIIEVPVDDLSKKAREKEKPDAKSLAALYAVARGHGPIGLQLNDSKLEVFDGPRGPDKLFTVLSLAIVDPNDNLAGLRSSYRDAGGKLSEKSAPMHLTLAYLKLGTKLDAPTEKRLLQIATRANSPSASSAGQPDRGWKQSALYYSGRYSDREFARLNLGE